MKYQALLGNTVVSSHFLAFVEPKEYLRRHDKISSYSEGILSWFAGKDLLMLFLC